MHTVRWRRGPLALELVLVLVILLEFSRVVAHLIGIDAALHWDEAVYAVRARGWTDPDAVISGWSYIRPPLLPAMASVGVAAGGEEWQLRMFGLAGGIGLLLATWWLARSIAGPVAGVVVVAILYLSPTLQMESAVFLTDVPAAALLVLLAALLWHELEVRPRPGWGLLLAAAVAGLAFLMRYGSLLLLAPLLATAGVIWWRKLLAAPRISLAALAIGAAFVVGHVAWSVVETGDPLGIVLRGQTVVAEYDHNPIAAYRGYVAFSLAGSVGHVAIYAGFAALPVAALAARYSLAGRRPLRAAAFVVVPALVHVVLLITQIGHVEERFFVGSTALLVTAGTAAAVLLARHMPPALRVGLLVGLVAALIVWRGPTLDHAQRRTVETARYYEPFRVAGEAMGDVAARDCGVLGGGYPILAWYSGCEAGELRMRDGNPSLVLRAPERWLILFDRSSPPAPVVAAALQHVEEPPIGIRHPETGELTAWAWRFSDE